MRGRQFCDLVGCGRPARWFLGFEYQRDGILVSRGHPACDNHLADGALATMTQLIREDLQREAVLQLRHIVMTDDLP